MAESLANPPPKVPPWTERNEVNLLNAVLEIANEPTESYNPRINLFDRINQNMEKSLTDREILDKIKELRKRFEKRCWKREFGTKAVKTTKAFVISEKIWGKGFMMKIERMKIKRERKMKRTNEKNAKSLKANPREALSPNPEHVHEPTKKRNGAEPKDNCQPAGKKRKVKGSCFTCGNVGHVARDCSEKKIANQSTKQQESEDISNKLSEIGDSSHLGSLQLTSEQTKQPDEVRYSPRPVDYQLTSEKKVEDYSSSQSIAHQPCLEQRMKFNNSQCDDNQYTSEHTKQREEVHDSFNPVIQDDISSQSVVPNQPSSEQGVKFNSLQCGDKQHVSEQTKQRDEMRGGSQPVTPDNVSSQTIAYPPSSEQRMKFNNLQRGDNQHMSEQTKQRDEMCGGSQPVAPDDVSSQSIDHQPSSEQRMKFKHSQCGDNQHTSELTKQRDEVQHTSEQTKQRDEVRDSSNPVAQDHISSQSVVTNQSSSEQGVKFNNLQCGDNQHGPEQTKYIDETHGGSLPVAPDGVSSQSITHQPSSEQRIKVDNSQCGDNQHTSEQQRIKVPSSFKSGAYQPTSNQNKPFNRFRYSSHQLSSHQWNRESLLPPILPLPPRWEPYHPVATPPSFPPYPVPYQYPAPPPPYRRSPPPGSMNYSYYPGYPWF